MDDPHRIRRMPLRSLRHGDDGHEIIHELIWAAHISPMTRCKRFVLRDDPSPEMERRNADLVVNCLECIAEQDE